MRRKLFAGAKIVLFCVLLSPAASAEDFLPLYPGNHWTYRASTGETFEITVGLNPIVYLDGRVYHRIRGYASAPLLVRSDESGALYRLNEETNQDELLTDFRPSGGRYYTTPISDPCGQDAQVQVDPVVLQLGGVLFPAAREIRYRIFQCADTGITEELYLENIGLARRTVQTIVGPRAFQLVSAKVGPLTLREEPGVDFRISLSPPLVLRGDSSEPVKTTVKLTVSADRREPVPLRFRTSQRYDIAVKKETGEIVYLWSRTALFLPVLGEEHVTFKEYTQPLSLDLEDGRYVVEAWLTTDSDGRQFAGSDTLRVLSWRNYGWR